MNFSTIEVNDKKSFMKFLEIFLEEYRLNGKSWENNNLGLFLESLLSYSEDIDGYYKNVHPDLDPEIATWRIFADILIGATMYE